MENLGLPDWYVEDDIPGRARIRRFCIIDTLFVGGWPLGGPRVLSFGIRRGQRWEDGGSLDTRAFSQSQSPLNEARTAQHSPATTGVATGVLCTWY